MPLIRSAATEVLPPAEPPADRIADLSGLTATSRREAAQRLGWDADTATSAAAQALARQLALEPEPSVREALLAALVRVGGGTAAALLAPLLSHAEPALRNGALEALKQLNEAAVPTIDTLLDNPNPDLRLLSADAMRAWPAAIASPRLHRRLTLEENVNVAGVLADAAAATGDASLLPALQNCAARFADEPFLTFAVTAAITALMRAGNTP